MFDDDKRTFDKRADECRHDRGSGGKAYFRVPSAYQGGAGVLFISQIAFVQDDRPSPNYAHTHTHHWRIVSLIHCLLSRCSSLLAIAYIRWIQSIKHLDRNHTVFTESRVCYSPARSTTKTQDHFCYSVPLHHYDSTLWLQLPNRIKTAVPKAAD